MEENGNLQTFVKYNGAMLLDPKKYANSSKSSIFSNVISDDEKWDDPNEGQESLENSINPVEVYSDTLEEVAAFTNAEMDVEKMPLRI